MLNFKHYCNKCGYVVNLDKTQEGEECFILNEINGLNADGEEITYLIECDGKLVRDYSVNIQAGGNRRLNV